MVTVTARKHIIAAIRRATLCSQRTAMNIVDANWYRIHSFDADMRLAEVTIDMTNPADFSGQLSLWENKTWKTTLEVPAGGLREIATCSIEVAYAERPNPYLPRVEGLVINARAHANEPSWVQIDLEVPGAETMTFAMIPMPWHTGDDLLRYAQSSEGRLAAVIYQDAADAITGGEDLPASIDPSESVAEFIVPMDDEDRLRADLAASFDERVRQRCAFAA